MTVKLDGYQFHRMIILARPLDVDYDKNLLKCVTIPLIRWIFLRLIRTSIRNEQVFGTHPAHSS
jgi:hypothetical protein